MEPTPMLRASTSAEFTLLNMFFMFHLQSEKFNKLYRSLIFQARIILYSAKIDISTSCVTSINRLHRDVVEFSKNVVKLSEKYSLIKHMT